MNMEKVWDLADEAESIVNIDTDAAAELDADHAALFAGWDAEDAACHERAEQRHDQAADDEDARDDAEWAAIQIGGAK